MSFQLVWNLSEREEGFGTSQNDDRNIRVLKVKKGISRSVLAIFKGI